MNGIASRMLAVALFAVFEIPEPRQSAGAQEFSALPRQVAESERDERLVELGRLLFFDPRLSGDTSIACADCHEPSSGWAYPQDLSKGYPMTANWRNSPTVVNSGFLKRLFWDGRASSLEEQARAAMTSPIEGNGHPALMIARLQEIPEYMERIGKLFNSTRLAEADIWRAIAAFERTLVDTDTPFDRFLRGEHDALSPAARRGMKVFSGKANCTSCHNGALLTDEAFHVTSVPDTGQLAASGPLQVTFRFKVLDALGSAMALSEDPGRFLVTRNLADRGAFRTAPLRHTRYTAPYMHNGAFWTLREVVDFYNAPQHATGSELAPIDLTEAEVKDLVAFLECLSGPQITIERPSLPSYRE
ncbi:cytochrome c peroxidase (plasmid) [Sinorhizobium meliloti]|nr:cytochrome c peroxidase [Sinorhizobium meliloti]